MSKVLKEYLSNLANAFREILGTTEKINAQDFPNKVTEVYNKGYEEGMERGNSLGQEMGFKAGLEEGKQAEYDRFWDSFQQNGNRIDYQGAFYGVGWNDETFKPKYNIAGQNVSSLFVSTHITNLEAILNECGVVLDTSNSSRGDNMFSWSRITIVPELHLTLPTYFTSMCYNATRLTTIRKIVLNNNGNQTFASAFTNANSLKDITFEGVIGQNIDFSYSPLIKASITNVINCLSTTATSMTATFKLTAVKTAFETSSGANDGNTSEEWLNLVATKPNWTINLV